MYKKRYSESYEQGLELPFYSEKGSKITRSYYRDLSHFSKSETYVKKEKVKSPSRII